MHPELQAWRERNGRANRIGDCDDDGKIPDWAKQAYPERSGGFTPRRIFGDHHRGGRYDALGYWIPNRIS
jgi:hypothetical protein